MDNAPAGTTVLVVEDDEGISSQLERGLRREGYDVVVARTGEEALRHKGSDLILLDLGLPDVDGEDLCAQLRATSASPIIVVSARGGQGDRIAALDLGADDYVVKPFGFGELTARMRAVLRRSGGGSRVLRHGPLSVDPRARTVHVDEREISLTPKEFDILEALMVDPGRVVTRQEISERVWGESWYGPPKALDVHVAALRRKLADPDLIVTIYGRGFRMGGG